VREQRLSVNVSILEVLHVPARGASVAVKLNLSNAPHPGVRVTCGGNVHEWHTADRDTSAAFDKRNRREFADVARDAALEVAVLDRRGRDVVCGLASIPLARLPAPDPVYMWVQVEHWEPPGTRQHSRARLKNLMSQPMLVHLRVQVRSAIGRCINLA